MNQRPSRRRKLLLERLDHRRVLAAITDDVPPIESTPFHPAVLSGQENRPVDLEASVLILRSDDEDPLGTQAITSNTGGRSVVANSIDNGLAIQIWSNQSASEILADPIHVSGSSELLDFDDASGLLVLRELSGGVQVLDVDNNLAALFHFTDAEGPVLLDPHREMLWAFSPVSSSLHLFDLRDGNQLATMSVDEGSIGPVAEIVPALSNLNTGIPSVAVIGESGKKEVLIDQAIAQRFSLDSTSPLDQMGSTENPLELFSANSLEMDGGLRALPVSSEEISSEEITSEDTNQPITGITPDSAFVFENAPGDVIVELTVEDQDPEQFHELTVDDDRFTIEEHFLRLADGVALDYEADDVIVVNVTASDSLNNDSFTQPITVIVRNLPEQPQTLELEGRSVVELVPGAEVGILSVDQVADPNGYYFEVNDPRFEVVEGTLKLVDGVWVRLEEEPEIELQVTAQTTSGAIIPVTETYAISVLENEAPYHNVEFPYDVNHDGDATALDALLIINFINLYGPGPTGNGYPGLSFDVNHDGLVTALDALLVINHLNRSTETPDDPPVSEGEGEASERQPIPNTPAPASDAMARYTTAHATAIQANRLQSTDQENHLTDQIESTALTTLSQPPLIYPHPAIMDWVIRQGTPTDESVDEYLSLLDDDDESDSIH